MAEPAGARPLTAEDAHRILLPLASELAAGEIVLIGGQAVLFWQEFFGLAAADGAVETSIDIDFAAVSADAVRRCAALLDGRARLPEPFDPTPSLGLVLFTDASGQRRQIDFVSDPIGLDVEDVLETAVPLSRVDAQGEELRIHVLHPERMLEGRVATVARLRRDPAAIAQLRSAIASCRAFLRWVMDSDALDLTPAARWRVVARLHARLFRVARSIDGLEVWQAFGIDVTEAVLDDHPALPRAFLAVDLPRRRRALSDRRARLRG